MARLPPMFWNGINLENRANIDVVELVGALLDALNAQDRTIVTRLPAALKHRLFIFLNLTGMPPAGNA